MPRWSFFHILEVEPVHQRRWAPQAKARHAPLGYIASYDNRNRMHSDLGHLTPKQAGQRMTV